MDQTRPFLAFLWHGMHRTRPPKTSARSAQNATTAADTVAEQAPHFSRPPIRLLAISGRGAQSILRRQAEPRCPIHLDGPMECCQFVRELLHSPFPMKCPISAVPAASMARSSTVRI